MAILSLSTVIAAPKDRVFDLNDQVTWEATYL